MSKNLPKKNTQDEISGREYELLIRHIANIEHSNKEYEDEINEMKNEIREIAGLIKVQQEQLDKQQTQLDKQHELSDKLFQASQEQQKVLTVGIETIKLLMEDLIALRRDFT